MKLTREQKDAVVIAAGFNLIWTEGQRDRLFDTIMADPAVAAALAKAPTGLDSAYAVESVVIPMNYAQRYQFRERVLNAYNS